jgi:drug/metabolite transporter (DMT)-like permease
VVRAVNRNLGVLVACLSSGLGGTAVAATRFVADKIDPVALGALRFGIGFLFLLPSLPIAETDWPRRPDWIAVGALGLLFFALFPILFNASLIFTTSARAGLALASLPLLTMIVAAALGREEITLRKALGIGVAMSGVAVALGLDVEAAPKGAWRGDLLMLSAALCMAFYNVLSKPVISRSGPLAFTLIGMGVGAGALVVTGWLQNGFAPVAAFSSAEWIAIGYLGIVCGALIFFLWAFALARTTPTRAAIAVALNPVMAALTAALILDEGVGLALAAGGGVVVSGIYLAATNPKIALHPN